MIKDGKINSFINWRGEGGALHVDVKEHAILSNSKIHKSQKSISICQCYIWVLKQDPLTKTIMGCEQSGCKGTKIIK